jgi:hypothetical protein
MRPFHIHYLEWATSCQPEKVGGTHHEVKNPTKSTITQSKFFLSKRALANFGPKWLE